MDEQNMVYPLRRNTAIKRGEILINDTTQINLKNRMLRRQIQKNTFV